MMTFAESPMKVPGEVGSRIFNAELTVGKLKIKASDDMPGYEVQQGTHISLYLTFQTETEKKRVFNALAEGGTIQFPIEDNFGMVKDKYGIQWMMVHDH